MTSSTLTYDVLIAHTKDAKADVNSARLQKAWEVAMEAYQDEEHWDGESMMDHVLGVLSQLLPFQPDEDTIIACLLHEVLRCKYCSLQELEEDWGATIRSLVSGVHLLSHVTLKRRHQSVDDLRLMLMTVSDDVRTVLIILCDRAYMMSQVHDLPVEEARRISIDVLQLFAPVAARLGIYSLKQFLESRAFPIIYPTDAHHVRDQLEKVHTRFRDFMPAAISQVREALDSQSLTASIQFREKQPYSLFRKMQEKNLTHVLDVYDLYAVRVLVDSEAECYQALGVLHRLGRPVTNRFKDYIAFPKPNGYQSLHTTVLHMPGVPEECKIEVQVRTKEMDREALFGVAAHWMYKEGGLADRAAASAQLHAALSSQESIEGDGPQLTGLSDNIFVLTPQGDVIELPEGATPLDFAFVVHTELGLSFKSARVNGSIISADYRLENGDVIEILRHKEPHPTAQWMERLTMASSRAKLKRYLNAQNRPENLALGRKHVNALLKKRGLSELDTDLTLLKLVDGEPLSIQQREDMLVKIGQDSERASALLHRVDALADEFEAPSRPEEGAESVAPTKANKESLRLESDLRMPVQFAKCCKPEEKPGSRLVGIVNRSGKVMVHRRVCRMVKNANPERKVKVEWE